MKEVVGKFVELLDNGQPGDFKFGAWHGEPDNTPPSWLLYICPCGCGQHGALQLRGPYARPARERDRPSWEWDGNMIAPTLTPSILHYELDDNGQRIGEHWHGYLRAGRWVWA